jgi:hypothetical protein
MPNETQSYANHSRVDPWFHMLQMPLGVVAIILSVILLFRSPGLPAVLWLVLALGFFLGSMRTRIYALRVQDRVIRLEERLRLERLLPEAQKPRIGELSEGQLIALRFASDAELPELARRTLDEGLTKKQIKGAIRSWRADHLRV